MHGQHTHTHIHTFNRTQETAHARTYKHAGMHCKRIACTYIQTYKPFYIQTHSQARIDFITNGRTRAFTANIEPYWNNNDMFRARNLRHEHAFLRFFLSCYQVQLIADYFFWHFFDGCKSNIHTCMHARYVFDFQKYRTLTAFSQTTFALIVESWVYDFIGQYCSQNLSFSWLESMLYVF